jgi:hypothetical protein
MMDKVVSIFTRFPRRAAVVGVGLLVAGTTMITTTGAAYAASGHRPVEVTFDNQSKQLISACIFGSGGRCTNGGIAAGATGVLDDPFNSKQQVKITIFETGTATPESFSRTVTAVKHLCATVTENQQGSLSFRIKPGAC